MEPRCLLLVHSQRALEEPSEERGRPALDPQTRLPVL